MVRPPPRTGGGRENDVLEAILVTILVILKFLKTTQYFSVA